MVACIRCELAGNALKLSVRASASLCLFEPVSTADLLNLQKYDTLSSDAHPIIFHPFAAQIQEGLEQDEGHLTLPQSDIRGQPQSNERAED